jgi:hypothetical protein
MGVIYRPISLLPDLGDAVTTATASINLSALRAVILDNAGQFAYADSGTPSHAYRVAGILPYAVPQDAEGVAYRLGEISDAVWSWTRGSPIFLGTNGQLTQTPATTGILLVLAQPISPTVINLVQPVPILLGI